MGKKQLFNIVLYLSILFGGLIQFFGILSNSQLTIIITLLIIFRSLLDITGSRKWVKKIHLLPFILLFLIIILSTVKNSRDPKLGLLYAFMFGAVPLSVYYLCLNSLHRFRTEKIINILYLVGLLQFPVILFQRLFYSRLSSISARQIDEEDFSFGTFFLANDHALCFLILCLFTVLIFTKYKPPYFHKAGYIVWFTLTILIANSKISFLLLGLILGIYIFSRLRLKRIIILGAVFIAITLILRISPEASDFLDSKSTYIFDKVLNSNVDLNNPSIQRNMSTGRAERNVIFLYYLNEPLSYFGEGPYTYWSPVTKQFRMFINFSQYIWFYSDLGLFGIFIIIFIYSFLYLKYNRLISYQVIFLILILVYSFFTNTLGDLAFNIIFFIFCLRNIQKPSTECKII